MSDQHLSDEALEGLLARTCAGDLNARNELFSQVFERLARLARRLHAQFPTVRRWEEAGDVLDSAMCRLLRAMPAVKPVTLAGFLALARTEMQRELHDRARGYSRLSWRRMHELPADSHIGISAEQEPYDQDDEPQDLEAWTALQEAIERLPVVEREVASLRLYHGWTEARIAELFDVSEWTIRQRWEFALAKLRHALRWRVELL